MARKFRSKSAHSLVEASAFGNYPNRRLSKGWSAMASRPIWLMICGPCTALFAKVSINARCVRWNRRRPQHFRSGSNRVFQNPAHEADTPIAVASPTDAACHVHASKRSLSANERKNAVPFSTCRLMHSEANPQQKGGSFSSKRHGNSGDMGPLQIIATAGRIASRSPFNSTQAKMPLHRYPLAWIIPRDRRNGTSSRDTLIQIP